jgi:serine/threonine-protein kinase RsbW
MPPPELNLPGAQRKIGGLGIHFIRQMSDDVSYRREDEKNILTITKIV